ncbi:MAG: hypothetical protein AAF415_11285 [Pseudomonadota bacterium]
MAATAKKKWRFDLSGVDFLAPMGGRLGDPHLSADLAYRRPRLRLVQGEGDLHVREAFLGYLGSPPFPDSCPKFRIPFGPVLRVETRKLEDRNCAVIGVIFC